MGGGGWEGAGPGYSKGVGVRLCGCYQQLLQSDGGSVNFGDAW